MNETKRLILHRLLLEVTEHAIATDNHELADCVLVVMDEMKEWRE